MVTKYVRVKGFAVAVVACLLFGLVCGLAFVPFVNALDTFGYTTIGGSSASQPAKNFVGSKFTSTQDGTLESISIYIGNDGAANLTAGVYSDSTGSVNARLAQSSSSAINQTAWNTFPLSLSVTTGQVLWLCVIGDASYKIYFDDGGTNQFAYSTDPLGSYALPDPASGLGYLNYKISIYATYAAPIYDIVCLGDSITKGDGLTPYPETLEGLLTGRTVANEGYNGRDTAGTLARWNEIKANDYVDMILLNGVVDIIADAAISSIKDNLYNMWMDAKNNYTMGVYALTLTPCDGYTSWNPTRQAELEALNSWIVSNGTASGVTVVDVYSLLENSTNAGFMNSTYDSGDHLHPNQAGADAIAAAVYAAMIYVEPTPSPSVSPSVSPSASASAGVDASTGNTLGFVFFLVVFVLQIALILLGRSSLLLVLFGMFGLMLGIVNMTGLAVLGLPVWVWLFEMFVSVVCLFAASKYWRE